MLGNVEVPQLRALVDREIEQRHRQGPQAAQQHLDREGERQGEGVDPGGVRQEIARVLQNGGVDVAHLDQRGEGGQQIPAGVAQVQQEQLALVAQGLLLAHLQGLHHPDARVLIEVVQGEAVAVGGDDAGDHKQQGPQEDEEILHDVQQDDPAHEGEPVEQRQVLRPLAPADGHAVQHEAGGEDHAQQAGEDADEHGRQAVVHQAGQAVRQVQGADQRQIQERHAPGADLRGAQQVLHLLLQLLSVDQLCHHKVLASRLSR